MVTSSPHLLNTRQMKVAYDSLEKDKKDKVQAYIH